MKTRIRYIKKNTTGYYAVQIKGWIFWKTIYTNDIFANVEKFIDTLAQIDEFNNKVKAKSLNKIVYEGWAVRNVYAITGPSDMISFFNSPINKRKSDDKTKMIWTDINGILEPLIKIHGKKLFGKECYEPMKLRITIEQIEE